MKRSLFSMAILACAQFAVVAGEGWKEYVNERFGFKFSHPSSLIAGRPPTNGGGLTFSTRDKEFEIAAWGQFMAEGETPEKYWADELTGTGASATYQRKGANWYVISGVDKGVEYYHKAFFQNGNVVYLDIDYPHAKNKQYDPWVEKIEKSFVPFLKGDFDRIVK
jgi:hypothetical protein